jgi:hypothetical protein
MKLRGNRGERRGGGCGMLQRPAAGWGMERCWTRERKREREIGDERSAAEGAGTAAAEGAGTAAVEVGGGERERKRERDRERMARLGGTGEEEPPAGLRSSGGCRERERERERERDEMRRREVSGSNLGHRLRRKFDAILIASIL